MEFFYFILFLSEEIQQLHRNLYEIYHLFNVLELSFHIPQTKERSCK